MINYFETNPSHRATCQKCKQFITDPKRGVEVGVGFGHKTYKYFCLNCCGELIKETKRELQNIEVSLKVQAKKLAVGN